MKPRAVLVLLAAIVFATVMFGIGSAVEKASPGTTSAVAHQEAPGGEAGGPEAPAGTTNNQEAIFGFNPEATPLIAAAIAGSIAAVGAVWFYWRRAVVLWATGAAMAAFAALDIVEIVHQVGEGHATLAALAGTVAFLHVAAAVIAGRLASAGPSMERAVGP